MPLTPDQVFRDFERYLGDGKSPAVPHPLPTGDPASGLHHLSKAEIRQLFRDFMAEVYAAAGAVARQTMDVLVVADMQPVTAEHVVVHKAVLDNMGQNFPTVNQMWFLGDLVDEGSLNNTGAAPLYSHADLKQDLRLRLPLSLSNIKTLPGNHDRDGTGTGGHLKAWTNKSYRNAFGAEYYYTVQGDLTVFYLGDLGGQVGGEQPDAVLDWFEAEIKRHTTRNVILCIHQPLIGAFPGLTAPRWFQQAIGSARISAVIAANPNIKNVFHGHVGVSLNQATQVTEISGVKYINCQMGIPTAYTNAWGEYFYSILTLNRGETTGLLRRYGSQANAFLAGRDVTLNFLYPLDLGVAATDFDGRFHVPAEGAIVDGPDSQYLRMSDLRTQLSPGVVVNPGRVQYARRFRHVDDAFENALPGHGTGLMFYNPGSLTITDGDGDQSVMQPGDGAGFAIEGYREASAQLDFTSGWRLRQGGPTGDEADMVTALQGSFSGETTGNNVQARTSTALPVLGRLLSVANDGSLIGKGRIGGTGNLDLIFESGVYYIANATDAATIIGVPGDSSGGILEVQKADAATDDRTSAAQCVQRYTMRSAGGSLTHPRVWLRRYGSSWGAWVELPTVILSSGTATEGYRQFSDGRMEAWKLDLSTPNANTALGSLFRSATVTWTLPAGFIGNVFVDASCDDIDSWVSAGAPTLSAATLRVLSGVTKAAAITLRARATGRWA